MSSSSLSTIQESPKATSENDTPSSAGPSGTNLSTGQTSASLIKFTANSDSGDEGGEMTAEDQARLAETLAKLQVTLDSQRATRNASEVPAANANDDTSDDETVPDSDEGPRFSTFEKGKGPAVDNFRQGDDNDSRSAAPLKLDRVPCVGDLFQNHAEMLEDLGRQINYTEGEVEDALKFGLKLLIDQTGTYVQRLACMGAHFTTSAEALIWVEKVQDTRNMAEDAQSMFARILTGMDGSNACNCELCQSLRSKSCEGRGGAA